MIQHKIKSVRARTGFRDTIPGTDALGTIIDEMEPRIATTYTTCSADAEFGDVSAPLARVTLKDGVNEIAVIPASLLREMFDELRPILDSENVIGQARRCQAPNLIRRIPRRRLLRLVLLSFFVLHLENFRY